MSERIENLALAFIVASPAIMILTALYIYYIK